MVKKRKHFVTGEKNKDLMKKEQRKKTEEEICFLHDSKKKKSGKIQLLTTSFSLFRTFFFLFDKIQLFQNTQQYQIGENVTPGISLPNWDDFDCEPHGFSRSISQIKLVAFDCSFSIVRVSD